MHRHSAVKMQHFSAVAISRELLMEKPPFDRKMPTGLFQSIVALVLLSQTPSALAERDELRFGMFVGWSLSSYSGNLKEDCALRFEGAEDNSSGVPRRWLEPEDFAAPDLSYLELKQKTDRWADVAKATHMSHILLLTKHVDGFCLWDTATTPTHKITALSGHLHQDLVKCVSESCKSRGLKLGFYYALRDRLFGWDKDNVKTQLAELLKTGGYGDIAYLWLDTGWCGSNLEGRIPAEPTYSEMEELAEWAHEKQPNIAVGFNAGTAGIGDFIISENGYPRETVSTDLVLEFTFPILGGRGSYRWFYTDPVNDGKCLSVAELKDFYDRAEANRNIFDINVGITREGDLRAIDSSTLTILGQRISREQFINDDDRAITYGPPRAGWQHFAKRGLGDYADDATFTQFRGAYCEYRFWGTGLEFITERNSDMGSVDVFLDGNLRKANLSLHSSARRVRQAAFSVAGLTAGEHTLTIVNTSSAWIGLDALQTFSGGITNLSVASNGNVWSVTSDNLIWRYRPFPSDTWERMPGTATSIGCGSESEIWKVGTDLPDPWFPNDFTIAHWNGADWDKIPGKASQIDVASDGAVWITTSHEMAVWRYFGWAERYDPRAWATIDSASSARDIGCGPNGSIWRIGYEAVHPPSDFSISQWNGKAGWNTPTPGAAARIDVASNGDVWVANSSRMLWRYSSGKWRYIDANAVDVACGGDGSVWKAGSDGTISRVE